MLQCLSPREVLRMQRMAGNGLFGGSAELEIFLKKLRSYGSSQYRHADLSRESLAITFAKEAPRQKDWLKYRLRELQQLIENYLLWQTASEISPLRAFLLANEYLQRNQPDGYEEARQELARNVEPNITDSLQQYLAYQLHLLQATEPQQRGGTSVGNYALAPPLLHRFYLSQMLHLGMEELNRATINTHHTSTAIHQHIEQMLANPTYQPLLKQKGLRQLLALYQLYQHTPTQQETTALLNQLWPAFEPLSQLHDRLIGNYLLNLLVKLNNRGIASARGLFETLVRAMYQNGLFDLPGSMTTKRYRSIVHIALENGQMHLARQMNELLHLKVPGPDGYAAWQLNSATILLEENRPAACINLLNEITHPLEEPEHLFMLRLRIKATYTLCQQRDDTTENKLWKQYQTNLKNAVRNLETYVERHQKNMHVGSPEAHRLFCDAMHRLMTLKKLPELRTELQGHHQVAARQWLLQQIDKVLA